MPLPDQEEIPLYRAKMEPAALQAALASILQEDLSPGSAGDALVNEAAALFQLAGGGALREEARALELAVDSLKLKAAARVGLSPLAPAYYLELLSMRGFLPRFIDVDIETGIISREALLEAYNEGIDLLLIDYPLGGLPPEDLLEGIESPIIEDVSQALGLAQAGRCGRYVVCALEEDSFISGGGGALLMAKEEEGLYALNEQSEAFAKSIFMTDVNAAFAKSQWSKRQEFLNRRQAIGASFQQALGKCGPYYRTFKGSRLFLSFPVVCPGPYEPVADYARSLHIETAPAFAFSSIARMPNINVCENAHELLRRTLSFPLYPELSKENQERIALTLSSLP